jgi:HAE1 family hydrophobic/amphiphilic exporter-1
VPVTIIGAFAAMAAMGFSVNLLTLFAVVLAIGIVVDDAIVVVEGVSQHVERGQTPKQGAIDAMRELFGPIIGITLVLMSVFLPPAFMPGITGQMYRQFALVIAATALISAVNALTLKPTQCALWLRPRDPGAKKAVFFRWFNAVYEPLERRYVRVIRFMVERSRRMAAIALVLIGLAGWGLTRVPTGFLPTEDQGYAMIAVQMPDGASLERTQRVLDEVSKIGLDTPGAAHAIAIGTGGPRRSGRGRVARQRRSCISCSRAGSERGKRGSRPSPRISAASSRKVRRRTPASSSRPIQGLGPRPASRCRSS